MVCVYISCFLMTAALDVEVVEVEKNHSDTKLFAVCELKLTMRPVSGMRSMGEYTSECPGGRGDIMRSVFWKKSEK